MCFDHSVYKLPEHVILVLKTIKIGKFQVQKNSNTGLLCSKQKELSEHATCLAETFWNRFCVLFYFTEASVIQEYKVLGVQTLFTLSFCKFGQIYYKRTG